MHATDESRRRGFAAVPDQVDLVAWDAHRGVFIIHPQKLDAAANAQAIGAAAIVKRMPGRWSRRWSRLLNLLGLDRGLGPAS